MYEKYSEFIVPDRLRASSRGKLSIVEETESDRARVLYSAAFRRLQRKTQVFPLEENAAVRSRLTHSLEVAHVGKFIATTIVKKMRKDGAQDRFGVDEDLALALINIVETACLLHDIGNPPFGHFGEAAICNWFSEYVGRSEKARPLQHDLQADFRNFDGNPQGFRVITRIAGADGVTGMNLLIPQIAATVKYPGLPSQIDKGNPLTRKAGTFVSDALTWAEVRNRLALHSGRRFPLAYMMEAADDISYCLSDIEDGLEKEILSNHDVVVTEILDHLEREPEAKAVVERAHKIALDSMDQIEQVVSFRSSLVRHLVADASNQYLEKHDKVLSGVLPGLLETGSVSGILLNAIRETVKKLLYGRRSSHRVELTGHAAITGILKSYECVLSMPRSDFAELLNGNKAKKHHEEQMRLISLIAAKHKKAYSVSVSKPVGDEEELFLRIHLIVDFVAGMTDVFALQTYQMLSGIR